MNSNKKIVSALLEKILAAKENRLSLQALEDNIDSILPALDSTFPKDARVRIMNLVANIRDKHAKNKAAALNTPTEFNYDENEGVEVIFNEVIQVTQAYLK